jgi:hypothetical protein
VERAPFSAAFSQIPQLYWLIGLWQMVGSRRLMSAAHTINPKTIDFCGPSADPDPFGTSKSTAIFNPLATTPIDVRYRRH